MMVICEADGCSSDEDGEDDWAFRRVSMREIFDSVKAS